MDRVAWQAAVWGVSKSRTRLKQLSTMKNYLTLISIPCRHNLKRIILSWISVLCFICLKEAPLLSCPVLYSFLIQCLEPLCWRIIFHWVLERLALPFPYYLSGCNNSLESQGRQDLRKKGRSWKLRGFRHAGHDPPLTLTGCASVFPRSTGELRTHLVEVGQLSLFQFSSVQSLSCARLFVTHELQHARSPCPSPTPGVSPNSCPSTRWCHPTISASVVPFSSCLQSVRTSGSFQMSQLFTSGGQNIGVSASTSVLPMNSQD